jgi:hypothetical protein
MVRLGVCTSKSRCDFPGEEILLDSLLALLSKNREEPCPLVAHTDFSAHTPRLGEEKKGGARSVCDRIPIPQALARKVKSMRRLSLMWIS